MSSHAVAARRSRREPDSAAQSALRDHGEPAEVVTDRAWALLAVVDELMPAAFHNTAQYANHRIEADHGRLKDRLRPMRGLKRDRTARVIVRGHAFMQNLRRLSIARHRRAFIQRGASACCVTNQLCTAKIAGIGLPFNA